MRSEASDANLDAACRILAAARPTAVNLQWGIDSMRGHLLALPAPERAEASVAHAGTIAEQDAGLCRAIG